MSVFSFLLFFILLFFPFLFFYFFFHFLNLFFKFVIFYEIMNMFWYREHFCDLLFSTAYCWILWFSWLVNEFVFEHGILGVYSNHLLDISCCFQEFFIRTCKHSWHAYGFSPVSTVNLIFPHDVLSGCTAPPAEKQQSRLWLDHDRAAPVSERGGRSKNQSGTHFRARERATSLSLCRSAFWRRVLLQDVAKEETRGRWKQSRRPRSSGASPQIFLLLLLLRLPSPAQPGDRRPRRGSFPSLFLSFPRRIDQVAVRIDGCFDCPPQRKGKGLSPFALATNDPFPLSCSPRPAAPPARLQQARRRRFARAIEWFSPNSPLLVSFSLHPHVVVCRHGSGDDDFSRSGRQSVCPPSM